MTLLDEHQFDFISWKERESAILIGVMVNRHSHLLLIFLLYGN